MKLTEKQKTEAIRQMMDRFGYEWEFKKSIKTIRDCYPELVKLAYESYKKVRCRHTKKIYTNKGWKGLCLGCFEHLDLPYPFADLERVFNPGNWTGD